MYKKFSLLCFQACFTTTLYKIIAFLFMLLNPGWPKLSINQQRALLTTLFHIFNGTESFHELIFKLSLGEIVWSFACLLLGPSNRNMVKSISAMSNAAHCTLILLILPKHLIWPAEMSYASLHKNQLSTWTS